MSDLKQLDMFSLMQSDELTQEEFDRWLRKLERKGDYSTPGIAFLIQRQHPDVNLGKLKRAFENSELLVWHHHDRNFFSLQTETWFNDFVKKHGYFSDVGGGNQWWFHPRYYEVLTA